MCTDEHVFVTEYYWMLLHISFCLVHTALPWDFCTYSQSICPSGLGSWPTYQVYLVPLNLHARLEGIYFFNLCILFELESSVGSVLTICLPGDSEVLPP